jgi:gamma-glutamyl:cysteine ligase YbdK (ATP-grasp superfamily)
MTSKYPIYSVLGIEIEYMLVDRDTLSVQPQSDTLLKALNAGACETEEEAVSEAILGEIAASNELVMHVLELKNNGPRPVTEPVADQFQQAILNMQPLLQQHNLLLLPTGAHPWMNPLTETKRWPHGNREIYQQYDSIFNCHGHGWANLQSMHVNLPFADDEEFSQLHNTIRLILPLLPALAASTPLLDGKPTGSLDSRLYFYDKNQERIPSITGDVIPEFIQSEAQYQEKILTPMYQAIRPFDPKGLLQYEWLNSRGAIPKFDYNAIEIRILDSQECTHADIAIAHVIHAILKSWNQASNLHLERPCETQRLRAVYDRAIKDGLHVSIDDTEVLSQWQLPRRTMTARDAWSLLIERVSPGLNKTSQQALEHILRHGNLSERILRACRNEYHRASLTRVYRQLGDCLLTNQQLTS